MRYNQVEEQNLSEAQIARKALETASSYTHAIDSSQSKVTPPDASQLRTELPLDQQNLALLANLDQLLVVSNTIEEKERIFQLRQYLSNQISQAKTTKRNFLFKVGMTGSGLAVGIGMLVFGAVSAGVAWIIPGLIIVAMCVASASKYARDVAIAYFGKDKTENKEKGEEKNVKTT